MAFPLRRDLNIYRRTWSLPLFATRSLCQRSEPSIQCSRPWHGSFHLTTALGLCHTGYSCPPCARTPSLVYPQATHVRGGQALPLFPDCPNVGSHINSRQLWVSHSLQFPSGKRGSFTQFDQLIKPKVATCSHIATLSNSGCHKTRTSLAMYNTPQLRRRMPPQKTGPFPQSVLLRVVPPQVPTSRLPVQHENCPENAPRTSPFIPLDQVPLGLT